MNTLPNKQKGVAIITALLIVAIATTISTDISTDLQLDIRRTSNILMSEQTLIHVQAAENLAIYILSADRNNNDYDHLDEEWARGYPPQEIDQAQIAISFMDLQGCFNINSLYQNGNIVPLALDRFERLLTTLGINTSIAQSVIDWIDGDQITRSGGAEDLYYTNLTPPYRAANTAVQSVSELKLIKELNKTDDYEEYTNLVRKHGEDIVCAFGAAAPINVNTAPAEVLLSLSNDITETDVENILDRRENDPFVTIADFMAFNNLQSRVQSNEGLTTSTEYFMLRTDILIGQVQTTMYSIINRRSATESSVIGRSQGVY